MLAQLYSNQKLTYDGATHPANRSHAIPEEVTSRRNPVLFPDRQTGQPPEAAQYKYNGPDTTHVISRKLLCH